MFFFYFCTKILPTMKNITVQEVFNLLIKKGKTFSSAESCTGGNIAHQITLMAGSSNIFKGTAVTYATSMKTKVLGVHAEMIEKHTVVSREVVEEMAIGVRNLMETDFGLATTGVAGPSGGTMESPVGTVWIGLATPDGVSSKCFHFVGDRVSVIDQATEAAYGMLKDYLTQN